MKKLAVIFVIGMVLLMTVGIVFADVDSVIESLEERGKEVINITEKEIGDANLALYEVDVGEEKPLFVITYSDKIFQETSIKETYKTYSRTFLNFGFAGEMSGPEFLKTSTGVEGSMNQGYVMMRKGSITGISTNLDIIKENNLGKIEIIIYKNGKPIGFGNMLSAVSSGVKKDYDLQSKDTVIFESGDIISVKVNFQENIIWKDVTTIIEITTLD